MLSEAPILLSDSVWTVGLWENACEFILMQRQVQVKEGRGALSLSVQILFPLQNYGDFTLSKHISPEETPRSFLLSTATLLWCELIWHSLRMLKTPNPRLLNYSVYFLISAAEHFLISDV